jgi:hypothetical protein
MKYKLFVLAALAILLISIVPAFGWEPPLPPSPPPIVAFIDPQEGYTFTAPCCTTKYFNATVVLVNTNSNKYNVYAWDFWVGWDQTYVELVDHKLKFPAGWVDGVDYTVLFDKVDLTTWAPQGWLHVGVTKLGNATGFLGDYLVLAWLRFHVVYEPVWHLGAIHTGIDLWDTGHFEVVNWTTACGVMYHPDIVEDMPVDLFPSRPNMEITFNSTSPVDTKKAQGYVNMSVVTAYLWISNVTKLYDIIAVICWNPNYLELDIQQVTINAEEFKPPWTRLEFEVDTDSGQINFMIVRPCEKDPIKSVAFWILKMDFKVKCVETNGMPIDAHTAITIAAAQLSFKDEEGYEWGYNPGNDQMGQGCNCIKISNADYYFTPIPGDFNQNGHVGIEDVKEMADHYGEQGTNWDKTGDGLVDIMDIVWVAKRYCNRTPPPMP